ncbi:MAG: hypothetical protein MJ177_06295 [Clostridia bacterium]|nr:hypothetical protein [Clostridia bacterium]
MAAENYELILKELQPVFLQFAFSKVKNAGESTDEGITTFYTSKKGTLKIDYSDNKIALYSADGEYSAENDDYDRLTMSLLDDESTLSDVKFIAADFAETIENHFRKKAAARPGKQKIQTVSKAAVKNGSSYDSITLANKLALIFPEFKSVIKENVEKYDRFLAEDFFKNTATPVIIDEIKKKDPNMLRKIFGVLNEMYDDGTNQVQSLIVVSILGGLENNTTLIAELIDYMSPNRVPQVIEVNQYLATRAGKRAQDKLDNPLKYRCKKKKQGGGLLSSLMGGGAPAGSIGQ